MAANGWLIVSWRATLIQHTAVLAQHIFASQKAVGSFTSAIALRVIAPRRRKDGITPPTPSRFIHCRHRP